MAEDKLNQQQQDGNAEIQAENVAGQAHEIVNAAMTEISNASSESLQGKEGDQQPLKEDNKFSDNFKGLPMRELIAAPLIAVAEAQQELAATAWDFYQKIAFYGKGETGATEGDTRIVKFKVKRPVEQHGQLQMVEQEIQAPFIGLVPIPSLLIDRVDVDFQMEVSNTGTNKSNFSSDVSTNISSGWFVKAEVSGKVSTSRENTRTTNQTGKYQVHVTASQQQQTEGLSKLMDIMASCIEPVPVGEQKQQ